MPPGTEIDAIIPIQGFFGTGHGDRIRRCIVERCLSEEEEELRFRVVSERGATITVADAMIVAVAGMDPGRYALIHAVAPDGGDLKVGRKRGRKRRKSIAS